MPKGLWHPLLFPARAEGSFYKQSVLSVSQSQLLVDRLLICSKFVCFIVTVNTSYTTFKSGLLTIYRPNKKKDALSIHRMILKNQHKIIDPSGRIDQLIKHQLQIQHFT